MDSSERLARIEEQLANLVSAINKQREDDHHQFVSVWAKIDAHGKAIDGNGAPGLKSELAAVKARVSLLQIGVVGIAGLVGGGIGAACVAILERAI